MLFNSIEFIFLFLPVALLLFFALIRFKFHKLGLVSLLISSLYFYGYWNFKFLTLIVGSILFNYSIGMFFLKRPKSLFLLLFGLAVNISLLVYYKYSNFFIENINIIFGFSIPTLDLILPLGISFFTFQQIAYLVDTYKSNCTEKDPIKYAIFVSLYPQLIAGPILHHEEILSQLIGGNKNGIFRECFGLIFTFLIGGIWHGAGWNFIIWGIGHGLLLVSTRLIRFLHPSLKFPKPISIFTTFLAVNLLWVFFRAKDTSQALVIIHKMFSTPDTLSMQHLTFLICIVIATIICFTQKNSFELYGYDHQIKPPKFVLAIFLFSIAVVILSIRKASEFLYFQF